jgi:solute:Na+ symporter, SSS family
MTDVIQFVVLVAGGLFLSDTSLNLISDGQGVVDVFITLVQTLPKKLYMILTEDIAYCQDLPVYLGGWWFMNLSYWGFKQYTVQCTLGAKNIQESQKGNVIAAFLKVRMPLIVVLPGIAALILTPDPVMQNQQATDVNIQ